MQVQVQVQVQNQLLMTIDPTALAVLLAFYAVMFGLAGAVVAWLLPWT